MDYLADLFIGSVAVAPLVIALVALAKQLGYPADKAPYLTGALGVLGYMVVQAIEMYPMMQAGAEVVATAVVIFLSASGVYQLGKTKRY